VLVASKIRNLKTPNDNVDFLFPENKTINDDIPEPARNYLMQANESMHAPDGAAMLAGSAVDAMLKAKELKDGSVYYRIDLAVEQNTLTPEMGEWAHSVRLGSNRPRHADDDNPHVSLEEAAQSIEFAKTLAHFLFVLPARVERGRQAVEKHEGDETASE